MPLAKDEKGGGTERNGEKSTKYCSHCYQDGAFTIKGITVDQMKERVAEKIVGAGFPRFVAKFFVRNLHELERWKGK